LRHYPLLDSDSCMVRDAARFIQYMTPAIAGKDVKAVLTCRQRGKDGDDLLGVIDSEGSEGVIVCAVGQEEAEGRVVGGVYFNVIAGDGDCAAWGKGTIGFAGCVVGD